MSKKIKLADVLWDAANEHLCENGGGPDWEKGRRRMRYSCNAIFRSLGLRPDYGGDGIFRLPQSVVLFLLSLGCDPDGETYFLDLEYPEQQGVRYMWLLLAMHVAEDENIEIEEME
jgi:hypothetical protein